MMSAKAPRRGAVKGITMKKELSRLALLQMMLVVYATLGLAVILKVRYYESSVPPELFATKVRDHSLCLLLIPALWCVGALFSMAHREADLWGGVALWFSGIAVAVALAGFALVATLSVFTHNTLVVKTPPPKLHGYPLPADHDE